MKLQFSDESIETIRDLHDKKAKVRLTKALDELCERGVFSTKVKKLKCKENIYRKRVGRYRILFEVFKHQDFLFVWVIRIKKGPKDYKRWISSIKRKIKNRFRQ